MLFSEIIGQSNIKQRLLQMADDGRVAHASLFCGGAGRGKLALALAYAQRLCCDHPTPTDACGTCPSCIKFQKLAHPDLHLVFPIVKLDDKTPYCADFMQQFTEAVRMNPYLSLDQWQEQISDGKQAVIYDVEGDEIIRQLSFKSFEASYKIMLIWCPECMGKTCANHLLKIIEEPPDSTVFLLVSDNPERLLDTIVSRTQRITVPPIDEADLCAVLLARRSDLTQAEAASFARNAAGSWGALLTALEQSESRASYFENFKLLMRHAYKPQRNIVEVRNWVNDMSTLKRPEMLAFMQLAQHEVRENFAMHLNEPTLLYMNADEQAFAANFSRFITADNVEDIMNELTLAELHVAQNGNSKFILFDLILKLFKLLNKN